MQVKKLALLGVIAGAVVGSPTVAQTCDDVSLSDLRGDANVPGGITGIATNTSDHELRSVALFFKLYGSNEVVVGNAVASQMNLAPGQQWRFQAATAQPFSRFELGSSNCVAAH